jgi:hypothetical protein
VRGTCIGLGVQLYHVFEFLRLNHEIVAVDTRVPIRTVETFLLLDEGILRQIFLVFETVGIYIIHIILFII